MKNIFNKLMKWGKEIMKPDLRPQKTKFTWYCNECNMAVKITAIKTHRINNHTVEQVSYFPVMKKIKNKSCNQNI